MKLKLEYVWIDGSYKLRSTVRIMEVNYEQDIHPTTIEGYKNFIMNQDLEIDGSSTGQATPQNSEIILKPVYVTRSPFKTEFMKSWLVLCDAWGYDEKTQQLSPAKNNFRYVAKNVFFESELEHFDARYSYEQQFYLTRDFSYKYDMDENGKWDMNTYYSITNFDQTFYPMNNNYCSNNPSYSVCHEILEKFVSRCSEVDLSITGYHTEAGPMQWAYQLGPQNGLSSADQLWLSRYILERTCLEYRVNVLWNPKPFLGQWSTSACHTTFSTRQMRQVTDSNSGLLFMYKAMEKLEKRHPTFIDYSGKNNIKRLNGEGGTSSFDQFSYGAGNRKSSVRISNKVFGEGCGEFEDRRPGSNMDPYMIASMLYAFVCLDQDIDEFM